jgi:SAM-dependent methyltransferase
MSASSGIVAGADYVRAITAHASDRRYRREFQALALKLTRPGMTLFDFGAGPGIDARFYAEHGRNVRAYDIDPRMCEYLAGYCRDFLASGVITLEPGDYREFLVRAEPAGRTPVELVTSNFAPLNLVTHLHELFAKFAALTGPGGAVLASVLSPYFAGDLCYGWWWRNAARLVRQGRYAVPGAQALIWRRRLADYAAEAAPYFSLEEIFPGTGTRVSVDARTACLRLLACRFMFLLFRKRAPPTAGS